MTERPGRFSPVLKVTLVAVVALLVGGAGGLVAARSSGSPGGSAPAAGEPGTGEPAASTPAPAVLPEMSEEFPDSGQRHLPEVSVSDVTQVRVEQGNVWDCGPSSSEGGSRTGSEKALFCLGDQVPPFRFEQWVEYDDETHVQRVEATCMVLEAPGPGGDDPTCRAVLTEVGGAAFGSRPGLRQQARAWVDEHIDSDSVTTIGGVRIEISLEPPSVLLTPAV